MPIYISTSNFWRILIDIHFILCFIHWCNQFDTWYYWLIILYFTMNEIFSHISRIENFIMIIHIETNKILMFMWQNNQHSRMSTTNWNYLQNSSLPTELFRMSMNLVLSSTICRKRRKTFSYNSTIYNVCTILIFFQTSLLSPTHFQLQHGCNISDCPFQLFVLTKWFC